MLILSNTTDKIQIYLGANVASSQLSCMSVYRDTTTTSIAPLRNVVNTNNTTLVDLVGSPASSTSRVVDYISVFNGDTQSAQVIIEFSDNGTLYTLFKSRIAPNERVEYQESSGFRVISNTMSPKVFSSFNIPTDQTLNSFVLVEDVTNFVSIANSVISVPNLKFTVQTGLRYWFRYFLVYTADATTTGSRWFLEGPSTAGLLSYQVFTSLTTTTQTSGIGASSWEYIQTSNATSASTGGNTAVIEGVGYFDLDGEVFLKFATEVALGTITLKKGSFLQFKQTA